MAIPIEFNLKEYNTGKFKVITRNSRPVDIVAIDEARNTMFGFYSNVATYWELDGSFYPGGAEKTDNDLFLVPKTIAVHLNITVNKYGKIDCYCSTKGKPRVKSGTTLLKYMEVEIN